MPASPTSDPTAPSLSSYLDPLQSNGYSNTPENNAWESFLVGKEGDAPPAKKVSISYLDHFDTDSNPGDLLSRSAN